MPSPQFALHIVVQLALHLLELSAHALPQGRLGMRAALSFLEGSLLGVALVGVVPKGIQKETVSLFFFVGQSFRGLPSWV